MRRFTLTLAAAAAVALIIASSASASFGVKEFDVAFTGPNGAPVNLQAGSHPFAMTTTLRLKYTVDPEEGELPEGQLRNLKVSMPAGFVGSPLAAPLCSTADFLTPIQPTEGKPESYTSCPDATAVGVTTVRANGGSGSVAFYSPVFNLQPAPGTAAKLGFVAGTVPVTIDVGVNPAPPHNLIATLTNISQARLFLGSELVLWGDPASPAHDRYRGNCVSLADPIGEFPSDGAHHVRSRGSCPVNIPDKPFLTLPRSCTGPFAATYEATSWQSPAETVSGSEAPDPSGFGGCAKLGFNPTISAKPTTLAAESPSGLDFGLHADNEGLTSSSGLSQSDIREAVVTLPEGFTTNPSIAEGLNVCSEADLSRESAFSEAGAGCPNASKIGTVEVETPLLEENVNGALYIAKPYENPEHSLLALYIVLKNPTLGISVIQPLKVETDPLTGRLTTVAEELPQLPFSHFRLHFREGTRSPLASPPGCGEYAANAVLTPWAGGQPRSTGSAFTIVTGPESGPCPTGGLPPFHPGLIAGTLNNAAGRFSPFNLRLSRTDSEQEITHFSIKLPPGIVGKLAGIPYCSDAAIETAKARTGPHGGQEELEHPSCPAASEIGHTLAGAGVGSSLTYAPGKVYLAGPYHGSNLSMVAITAGVVGPFDIGTVVIREGFKIDPETAEVFIDSTGSDPIPHIIKGIPVHLRDIRAYVDKPNFVLNPTDCSRTSTASTLLGSGLDFGSEADDRPVTVSTPFQAADCAALPFKPKLGLSLKGGTKRGAHPAFTARLAMNGIGEAGIQVAQVTLPKSEFIANAHFKTICTRVQFKAGAGNGTQCPAGSVYGKATAVTPILGEPLTGPVFLRSSEHQLPDLVVALHNAQVDFDLVGHVDSVKGKLRNTFEAAPDAPVSSFVLEMQGGKKGLFENSTNLCASTHKAISAFTGQNGKAWDTKPVMKVKCAKGRKKRAGGGAHKAR